MDHIHYHSLLPFYVYVTPLSDDAPRSSGHIRMLHPRHRGTSHMTMFYVFGARHRERTPAGVYFSSSGLFFSLHSKLVMHERVLCFCQSTEFENTSDCAQSATLSECCLSFSASCSMSNAMHGYGTLMATPSTGSDVCFWLRLRKLLHGPRVEDLSWHIPNHNFGSVTSLGKYL